MIRRGSLAVRAVLAVMTVMVAADASANGRSPITNGVFFRPADAQSIYVRSTFGLLVSHDDGCSFRWVCEQAIGYGGEFDPKYAVATDGTIFATTFTGLRVSRDGGCTWSTATADKPAGDPGRLADTWIDALDIASNGDVWVATAESGRPNNVYRSTDNGLTFSPRNMSSATVWWKSVKVAPTNAQRVYVTGYQVAPAMSAHFLASTDGGATWTPSPLANVMYGFTPIIHVSRIDPASSEIVFMTSLGANPPNGDRLYRSIDGGVTFTEALATTETIRDLVYNGADRVLVATGAGGYQSTANGEPGSFTPLPGSPQLGCLGDRDGQLIGCGANWQPDFKAVTRSTDAATWTKTFRFVELAGPLQCGPGTTAQTLCDPMWPALQAQFGATGPTGPACTIAPDAAVPPPPKNGGCCDTGAGGPIGLAALVGWLGVLLVRARRARTARC